MNMSLITSCAVPSCPNNSSKTPTKVFFPIPGGKSNKQKRNIWLNAISRDSIENVSLDVSPETTCYCCDDHFTLEEDTVNYRLWKKNKAIKLKLKSNVVPHKFECQRRGSTNVQCQSPRKALTEPSTSNLREKVEAGNKPSSSFIKQEVTEPPQKKYCPPKNYLGNTRNQSNSGMSSNESISSSGDGNRKTRKTRKSTFLRSDGSSSDESLYHCSGRVRETCDYNIYNSGSKMTDGNLMLHRGLMLAIEKNPMIFLGLKMRTLFIVNKLETVIKTKRRDIFITLRKMRQNESFELLAILFDLEYLTVWKIFKKTVQKMAPLMKQFLHWPSANEIRKQIPVPFQTRYNKIASVVDFLEIDVGKQEDRVKDELLWSLDKECYTFKYLISFTLDGLITFVSDGYGGRATDAVIAEKCGYLNKLSEGTWIMTDRHRLFDGLSSVIEEKGCKLVKAPRVSVERPCTGDFVKLSKKNKAMRIYVERVLDRLREFQILQLNAGFDWEHYDLIDKVVVIACGLVNMQRFSFHLDFNYGDDD